MVTIGGYPTPLWTPERAMGMMDSYGIQMQVLSLSDPGVSFLKGQAAATLARQVNEYTADLVRQHPTRFGGFAVLPLPDVAASLVELDYALGTLGLDGVGLLTSYEGTNIATPSFDPLWAEINRRKAFVFMHPATLSADDKPSSPLPDFLVEFTFETTRTISLMLNTALTTRYRDLRVQFAHAGGAFPYLNYRVGVLTKGGLEQITQDRNPEAVNGALPVTQTKGLYYDTALNPAPAAMKAILENSDISHIVFGSDWPFTELLFVGTGDPQPQLSRTFNQAQRHAIERANALNLLPSVASRLGVARADNAVDAGLSSTRFTRTKKGQRVLQIKLQTGETTAADAQLLRGGRRIVRRQAPQLSSGTRTLRLPVPRRTKGGPARIAVSLRDPSGNTRVLRKKVRIPSVR